MATRKTSTTKSVNETVVATNATVDIVDDDGAQKNIKPVAIDWNMEVPVVSNYQGVLGYTTRSGDVYYWEEFGDVNEMSLNLLRTIKNTNKKYFVNNWFSFSDEYSWVLDALGVRGLYKNALPADRFDELFSKSPDEIEKIVSGMTDGQKQTVKYRAITLIDNGMIDSRKSICALEDALGEQLVEK